MDKISITKNMNISWKTGEAVRIWSVIEQREIDGVVYKITETDLQILILKNQKIYTYNLDGSARLPGKITGRRVYSLAEKNYEVLASQGESLES